MAAVGVAQGGAGASEVRSAEYDAFGPWIDEIRTPDDVPPLFRDHRLDLGVQRLVLKVPRNIARRDATPDMDLYDHLLAVGPTQMTVLTRQTGGYAETVVSHDQIAAFDDSVNLLDGRLTIHTLAAGTVSIPYNGSSQQVVARLVRLLRELSAGCSSPPPAAPSSAASSEASSEAGLPAPALPDLGRRDIALVTSLRDLLREEPDMRLLAAHGRRALVPRGGALPRALHLAHPMNLQGAVVCSDGTDLVVLGRRDRLIRGNRTVHSLARLVVPLRRLEAVTVRDHPRYLGVRVVTLRAGAASLDLPVPQASAAERVLLGCAAHPEAPHPVP